MNFLSNWLAKITKPGSEELSFPIQQFEMNGRVGDAYIVSPYGVHANLPEGQPSLNISPDGTILMGIDPVGRIKVEAGEVIFYHPVTKSKTHYKNNGDIDIETPNTNHVGNMNITGNLNVTGDLNVDGHTTLNTLEVSGLGEFNGGIESNGTSIDDTHAHSGVSTGPSNTGGVV